MDEKGCFICRCDQQRKTILEVRELVGTSLDILDKKLVEERRKTLEEQIKAERNVP